jgi:type III secretory pathway lipoprotein EscJ
VTAMVHAAVASDANEAEEMQEILRAAGIESELEPEIDADAIAVLVPESDLEAAKDAIESGTEPDEIVAEP